MRNKLVDSSRWELARLMNQTSAMVEPTSCAHQAGDLLMAQKNREIRLANLALQVNIVSMRPQVQLTEAPAPMDTFVLITLTLRHTILLKVVSMLHLDPQAPVLPTHSVQETWLLLQLAPMVTIPILSQRPTTSLVAFHTLLDNPKEALAVLVITVLRELNLQMNLDALRVPIQPLVLNLPPSVLRVLVQLVHGVTSVLHHKLHALKVVFVLEEHLSSLQIKTNIPALLVQLAVARVRSVHALPHAHKELSAVRDTPPLILKTQIFALQQDITVTVA
jgi:hypothetical protein